MYKVQIEKRAKKELEKIPKEYLNKVINVIFRLSKKPIHVSSRKLMGVEGYRLRVGPYRILYDIDRKNKTVNVYRIKHRKESYR